jgi:hypothetical protein
MISFQTTTPLNESSYNSSSYVYEENTVGALLKQIMSLYGLFEPDNDNPDPYDMDGIAAPKSYLKDVTFHLATINKSGKVSYIEKDLIRNKSNGFWMWWNKNDGTKTQTPNEYRTAIGDIDSY